MRNCNSCRNRNKQGYCKATISFGMCYTKDFIAYKECQGKYYRNGFEGKSIKYHS